MSIIIIMIIMIILITTIIMIIIIRITQKKASAVNIYEGGCGGSLHRQLSTHAAGRGVMHKLSTDT